MADSRAGHERAQYSSRAALNVGKQGGLMSEREAVRQAAELLRGIIRSIDKKLDYSVLEQNQEGRFALRISTRGREGIVSLRTEDLQNAGGSAVRKNAIRQKIKSKRDHLLCDYVVDVLGIKVARLLKQSPAISENFRPAFSRRPFMGRRR
jgi:hypothetical protein